MKAIYNIFQRISYGARGDRRYSYFDALKRNINLSRSEMQQLQNTLLKLLIRHAYDHTSYYRGIMDSQSLKPEDMNDKNDLMKLPVLTKSIIRKNITQIKSKDNYSKNLIEVTSGGSTGNQALIYESPFYNQMSRAAFLRNNLLVDWQPADKSVWIWGAPYEHEELKGSLIKKAGIFMNRRLLLNAYKFSQDDFPYWVKKIEKFRPKILYGYASIILDFAEYLIRANINLISIKKVVSTTETLNGREIIEKAFNCKVHDQYGSREVLSIAIEPNDGVMRVSDDTVVLNINEQGEFLITALHSYGFPLINYKIGDCGKSIEDSPNTATDALPFSGIKLTIGRITDNFLAPGNKVVSSSAIGAYLSTFRLPIQEHQIIQNDYDRFVVNFIPDNNFNLNAYQGTVTKVLTEYFSNDINIIYTSVDIIPKERSGKKLMFKRTFSLDG